MKMLVTGGAGFVGLYLARRLVGAGHQVAALDGPAPSWSTADAVADRARAAWAGAPVPT